MHSELQMSETARRDAEINRNRIGVGVGGGSAVVERF
jgi:hypothetical protein